MKKGMQNNLLWVILEEFLLRLHLLFQLIASLVSFAVFSLIESMTEEKKSTKRKLAPETTVCNRSAINANWEALLSSNMLNGDAEKKTEPKEHKFTGTFRRARKKNKPSIVPAMNSLNITKSAGDATENRLSNDKLLKERGNTTKEAKLTKVLAMDCEMVGVGLNGAEHMIARVSVVNRFGDCVYDKFVKPREEVTDYRTEISGVRKADLLKGEEFRVMQKEVAELLRGRILVGHSIKHDLDVLFLSHPKKQIRDTSKYKPFRKVTHGHTPSLKRLAAELLGADIQTGEHSSVEDARAAMMLYCRVAGDWEKQCASRKNK